jgi:hypothetical protein
MGFLVGLRLGTIPLEVHLASRRSLTDPALSCGRGPAAALRRLDHAPERTTARERPGCGRQLQAPVGLQPDHGMYVHLYIY